jgi:hypothetical protein
LGKAFLEYTEDEAAYGRVRDNGSVKGLKEVAFYEARHAKQRARSPGFSDDFESEERIPGPFRDNGDCGGDTRYCSSFRHIIDSPPSAPMRDAEGRPVRADRRLRLGLSFSELCAPVYYFVRTGILILRTHEAWRRAASLALKYEQGVCAPMQQRDDEEGSTCSDVRRPLGTLVQDKRITSVLHPPKGPCECGPRFALESRSTTIDP